MFRLSKITDYGIVLLARLATTEGASGQGPSMHNARALAEEVSLPFPVVSKILKSLARRGILESHRGAKGGYSLSRNPGEITVAQMIEALEGPVALTECSNASAMCTHESRCPVRDPWQLINNVVHTALSEITLADLVNPHLPVQWPLNRLLQDADEGEGRSHRDPSVQ